MADSPAPRSASLVKVTAGTGPLALSKRRFPNAPPAFLLRLVLWLYTKAKALVSRLAPAELILFEMTTGIGKAHAIGATARFGIPDLLEKRGPLAAKDIATTLGLHADAVHRTLRGLASTGVYEMHFDGRFANNRISRALTDGRLTQSKEWALYFCSDSNAAAWANFDHSLKTGESAFTAVHKKNVWEHFDEHPHEREMFARAMMGITTVDAPVIASLYPFREAKIVCDVGGGRGTLLSEVLLRHRHLKGILAENEGVLASARIVRQERGLESRMELVASNFFESVPEGADHYMMKNILHDWDDVTCIKILTTVRRAMKKGDKLIVCESLVERLSRDPLGTLADLQMMIACERGRERSLDEFQRLFRAAGLAYRRRFAFPTTNVLEAELI